MKKIIITMAILILSIPVLADNLVLNKTGDILDDTGVDEQDPLDEFGALGSLQTNNVSGANQIAFIKFNLSQITAGSTISEAFLRLKIQTNELDAGEAYNVSVYHIYTYPSFAVNGIEWKEGTCTASGGCANATGELSWGNIPTASSQMNLTPESNRTVLSGDTNYKTWNVTEMIRTAIANGDKNITIQVKPLTQSGSPSSTADQLFFESKDDATASFHPALNVTFTPPTEGVSIFVNITDISIGKDIGSKDSSSIRPSSDVLKAMDSRIRTFFGERDLDDSIFIAEILSSVFSRTTEVNDLGSLLDNTAKFIEANRHIPEMQLLIDRSLRKIIAERQITEISLGTDFVSRIQSSNRNLNDTIHIIDIDVSYKAITRIAEDTVTIRDALERILNYNRKNTEIIIITDKGDRNIIIFTFTSDRINPIDVVGRIALIGIQRTDLINSKDQAIRNFQVNRDPSELLLINENILRNFIANRNSNDIMKPEDFISRLAVSGRDINDLIYLADTNARIFVGAEQVNEEIIADIGTFKDVLNRIVLYNRRRDDILIISDDAFRNILILRSESDQENVYDILLRLGLIIREPKDSTESEDLPSRLSELLRFITSPIFGTDDQGRTGYLGRAFQDIINEIDAQERIKGFTRTVEDIITGKDSIVRLFIGNRKIDDTLLFQDGIIRIAPVKNNTVILLEDQYRRTFVAVRVSNASNPDIYFMAYLNSLTKPRYTHTDLRDIIVNQRPA